MTEVIDGDTIKVLIGDQTYTVRYIGIDALETDDAASANRELAEAAAVANRNLVEGKVVRLEKDVSETDRYGRLLRYVYVGDLMVNAELVRLGQAVAQRYPPDTRNHDLLKQLEAEAIALAIGIWSQPPPEPTARASTEIVEAVQVEPTAMPARKPNAPAQITIVALFRDGALGQNEPDEYVEFTNSGTEPVDMTGWHLESERRGDDSGQVFHFPTGFVLKPHQVCRIYTDEDHPEWCGLSFNHGRGAIWSNHDPDAALLYDATGSVVARFE